MKKIILIIGLFLLTLAGFSQAVTVTLTPAALDPCVYPQQGTQYVVHVMIMNANQQLITQGYTVTSNTSVQNQVVVVNLPSFCNGSEGQIFQVLVEAAKIISGTETILCREKTTIDGFHYCSEFAPTPFPASITF